MRIRPETAADIDTIRALTEAAFAPMTFSDGDEQEVIDRLRADGDLTLSLVAEDAGAVAGHVAFSPVTLGVPGEWFALGPIAVWPERQGAGLGRHLIEAGLDALRARNAAGCVLTGNPALYGRFGFRNDLGLTHRTTPEWAVQGLAFGSVRPTGEIRFAAGFGEGV
ncbi:GNAT family N-acetyltransferase [Jannaschia marina]|uniref:GNAT family N-acetyltransferase n=1 Tax=Jannaschia marina TaxID=2741674 RepID=UPI0015C9AD2D|nr:N-acetyltransferase [Jannaschia marina]